MSWTRLDHCPVCKDRLHLKRLKMRAYGAPRFKTWCHKCDRCYGQFGYFSKKTARRESKNTIKENE